MAKRAEFDFYVQMLSRILKTSWQSASADWKKSLSAAIKDGDVKRVKSLLKTGNSVGAHARAKLSIPVGGTLLGLQRKAAKYWADEYSSRRRKAVEKAGGSILNDPDRRERLRGLKQEQIENFVEEFPNRILHPEIERLVDLMSEYESGREIDLAEIAGRCERLIDADDYWNELSSVEVSRMWHGDGVDLAKEQGMTRMQIIAMLDDLTCDVCLVFHGSEVNVEDAADRYEKDGEIEDPEEYAQAWAFPRFNEVQLMDAGDLTDSGYLPPFHPGGGGKGGCRCTLRPLYGDDQESTPKEE
jgi:hypothetical protein